MKFDMDSVVTGINQINDGKKVIVVGEMGDLSIIDLDTMQISDKPKIDLKGGKYVEKVHLM